MVRIQSCLPNKTRTARGLEGDPRGSPFLFGQTLANHWENAPPAKGFNPVSSFSFIFHPPASIFQLPASSSQLPASQSLSTPHPWSPTAGSQSSCAQVSAQPQPQQSVTRPGDRRSSPAGSSFVCHQAVGSGRGLCISTRGGWLWAYRKMRSWHVSAVQAVYRASRYRLTGDTGSFPVMAVGASLA